MTELPPFAKFYGSLNDRAPFPWQERLAAHLADGSPWPAEIGIPTGLGKTACLDIALWWLASQADRNPANRTAPTRIWWLVNRRLLVDSTALHAERVAKALVEESAPPLRAVSERLRGLSADESAPPLEVVRLRGGVATSRPTDPSQPAIVLATLPMYGSRLLFRGYGSSRGMRPIDAALAGTDSLVLVDEAHLAHHLTNLFEPLAACESHGAEVLPPERHRPIVVSLTATGSAAPADQFTLDEADRSHPAVRRRLAARKPVRILELPARTDPVKAIVGAVAELLAGHAKPTSCVAFANTPDVARRIRDGLDAKFGSDEAEVRVITGRQREREAGEVRRFILDEVQGSPASRPDDLPRERHLVVVATQTLEVGADVDFDFCVTEACGVRALTQRLGRVNRLGRFDHAQAVYVHAEPTARGAAEPEWPVYSREPLDVLERLRAHAHAGHVELGPDVVAGVLGVPGDDPGRAPQVLPAILWEWAKTTCPPQGEAPVEPYFSGLARPQRRISVCWRAYLPEPGAPIWPRVRDSEAVDLPLDDALRTALAAAPALLRLGSDRVTTEPVSDGDLRPGDTVILPSDAGLLDADGWNLSATDPVVDVSLLEHGLPLEGTAFARLVHDSPRRELTDLLTLLTEDDPDPQHQRELLDVLVAALQARQPSALPEEEWQGFVADLDLDRGIVTFADGVPRLLLTRQGPGVRADLDDELSAEGQATSLTDHGEQVRCRASAIASAIGVARPLAEVVGRSALFHDTGKADARFQRWLDPRSRATQLLAKSTTPRSQWRAAQIASGWPSGGRHEELSGRLVQAWLPHHPEGEWSEPDKDLLVHLVTSHHGHGRPFLAPVPDPIAAQVRVLLDGVEVEADADLSVPDWDQPDRFARLNRRYGHWGLALLEAIVRQADHAESARTWSAPDQEVT